MIAHLLRAAAKRLLDPLDQLAGIRAAIDAGELDAAINDTAALYLEPAHAATGRPPGPSDLEYNLWPQSACTGHARDIGWRCRPCGWETYSLHDMHTLVNRPNPDGTISLVCPRCGTEGDFIDAER